MRDRCTMQQLTQRRMTLFPGIIISGTTAVDAWAMPRGVGAALQGHEESSTVARKHVGALELILSEPRSSEQGHHPATPTQREILCRDTCLLGLGEPFILGNPYIHGEQSCQSHAARRFMHARILQELALKTGIEFVRSRAIRK
jgi:hypothetical protein